MQPYDSAVRLSRRQALDAVHPERVLGLQRSEVGERVRGVGGAGVEPDHGGEERRLAAAEVVGAVAVRNVPVRLSEIREVVEHAAHEVGPTAPDEPEHREERVPVVDLAEPPARDDVPVRQLDQRRRPGRGVQSWTARQHRPERADVRLHASSSVRAEARSGGPGQLEVLRHERPQVEPCAASRASEVRSDLGWRAERPGIHEGLRVGEDP